MEQTGIQNFLILVLVATAFAFLLWQLVRPWKKKNPEKDKDCDKCG